MKRSYARGVIAVALFAAAGGAKSAEAADSTGQPSRPQGGAATPTQIRIAELMAARAAEGLPTPTVSFEFYSPQGFSVQELESKARGPMGGFSFTAKTIIRYEGPGDAGLQRWPPFSLTPAHSRTFGLSSEELRDRYVERMSRLKPGFWERHELGLEPRTYTIKESGTTMFPATSDPGATPKSFPAESTTATTADDLVFGFSVTVPNVGGSWTFGFEDVEELTVSFNMDWGVGLRLPVTGQLSSPGPLVEGSTYLATSTLQGRNYSEAEYLGVGLPGEGGSEAYFRYTVQGCVELSGVIDSGEQCVGPDIQRSRDFVTPLGPGKTVPFPTARIAILDYGIAGIDLDVDTSVGSDKVTADWSVIGAAVGSGRVVYSATSSPELLGPIQAIDGPGQALFSVDGFLYHFTQFTLKPSARVWVDVEIPIPVLPDLSWEDSFSQPLGTYDLSDLIRAADPSVGVHHNESYTGGTRLIMNVPVVNVAPTAAATVGGGELFEINGIPTVVGNTGEVFTFTGTSHDPGRDDLTLSWDWADGDPAPDQSTFYPLAGPTGPNNAMETRIHAFSRSCLYDVTFRSVDDDEASAEAHLSILVTETGNAARLEGFWQKQLGRNGGNLLDAGVIDCYLAIVGRVSTIFSEVRDASTAAAAVEVVNLSQNSGSEQEQLDREILVAWLNFASGALGYSQFVDTDGDGDTPLYQAMQQAEAVRFDPSSTAAALKHQTELVHHISVQFTGKSTQ